MMLPIEAPAPGMTPMIVPKMLERSRHFHRRVKKSRHEIPSVENSAAVFSREVMPASMMENTSVIANRPSIAGTKEMPSHNCGRPSVKRCSPDRGSVPMVTINRPMKAEMTPFSQLPLTRLAMMVRPNTPSAKYWTGPKAIAKRASGIENSTSATALNRPPKVDDLIETLSASPVRPCWVMT